MDGVKELKACDITMCVSCRGPLIEEGSHDINFYRVTVANVIVDVGALQERRGLQMIWHNAPGSAALADVFAPSSTVAHEMPAKTLNFCFRCAMKTRVIAVSEMENENGEEG